MNKKKYIGLFSLILLGSACSGGSDSPDNKSVPISITTGIQTRAVMTAFSSGDKMNLFVKNVSSVTSSDFKSGVSASYNGTAWTITPSVELASDSKAYIYAVYPYSASNTDASAIPVDVKSQIDYLYSSSAVSVSYSSPQAMLTMKHAMAMLAFNISNQGYSGAGNLTSIKLSGDGFYTTGKMNVETGLTTGAEKGTYQLATSKTITAAGWTKDLPQAFCIPFSSTGKNVSVVMTIDGKDFTTYIPSSAISLGMKYVFQLALTDNGLTIFPDKTETISLNKDDDSMSLNNYGLLRLSSTSTIVSAPQITGTDITGVVYWGDNSQDEYKYPLTHTYTTTGDHNITIETWGGAKLIFSDLINTETIDLTSF